MRLLVTTALALVVLAPPPAVAVEETCFGLAPTIIGTPGDDTLVGTDGPDVVLGLGGDDVVRGLGGADVLCGGPGDDVLTGGAGLDRIDGGSEADSLYDRQGSAILLGGPGADLVTTSLRVGAESRRGVDGGEGVDTLRVEQVWEGRSTLARPLGLVNLRTGVVRVETHGPRTTAVPVAGIENVVVGFGRWTLVGDAQDNRLEGGRTRTSHVVIHAGGGDDFLTGTRHDDLLDGGAGSDAAQRTAGHDRYVSVERIR